MDTVMVIIEFAVLAVVYVIIAAGLFAVAFKEY